MRSDGATRQRGSGRVGGFEVVGSTPRGALVVGGDGARLCALVVARDRAAAVLRGPLVRLPPHAHRESLVEVAAARDSVVLLTTPPAVSTLETVLASREPVAAGVLVTILGPVVETVREASAQGIDLVVAADTIGLTSDGAPVVLVADLAESEGSPADALRSLIARCGERCSDRLGVPEAGSDLTALERFLYRAATPLPVGRLLHAEPAPTEDAPPSSADAGWAGGPARWIPRRRPTAARCARAAAGPTPTAEPGRHRRAHPLDGWQARVAGAATKRRGPITAAAAIVIGAVVASAVGASPAPAPSSQPQTRTASARPSTAPTPPASTESPGSAAAELLAAAGACAGSAPSCLSALTTPDSPLRSGGATRLDTLIPREPEVRAAVADENGGSALVSLQSEPGTTAASVLIIRTEAGWLIRDVFADDPP